MTDRSGFLGSEGLPYHFRSFTSEGTLANPDEVISGGAATFALPSAANTPAGSPSTSGS